MIKRALIFFLTILLVLSFVGCGRKNQTGAASAISWQVPNLQDNYTVNLKSSQDDTCECQWLVLLSDGKNQYEEGTTYWKYPDNPSVTITPYEMQSDVWMRQNENSYKAIASASLTIEGNVMSWYFEIPEEYGFDTENVVITGSRISVIV